MRADYRVQISEANVRSRPGAPVLGGAAIWPLSVEHRTVEDAASTAAPDPKRKSRSFAQSPPRRSPQACRSQQPSVMQSRDHVHSQPTRRSARPDHGLGQHFLSPRSSFHTGGNECRSGRLGGVAFLSFASLFSIRHCPCVPQDIERDTLIILRSVEPSQRPTSAIRANLDRSTSIALGTKQPRRSVCLMSAIRGCRCC